MALEDNQSNTNLIPQARYRRCEWTTGGQASISQCTGDSSERDDCTASVKCHGSDGPQWTTWQQWTGCFASCHMWGAKKRTR
jgi:hypothetical protein